MLSIVSHKGDGNWKMYKKILSGIFWSAVVFLAIGVVFCLFALAVIFLQKLKNG